MADETLETATLPRISAVSGDVRRLWSLVQMFGPGAPRFVGLGGELTLGRAPSCGFVIDAASVSRVHASIAPSGDAITIRDHGSHNGTFVDGRPVHGEVRVDAPALLRAGECVLRLCRTAEPIDALAGPGPLVGGPSLAAVRRQLELIAPTDLAVVVRGPTGTGKDVVARALHDRSGRTGAFVPVNCAAIPANLVEATLFGHTKGAFTGAGAAHEGLVAASDGGTLFLDEVAELGLEAQAKLLRVLQDGVVRPVGAVAMRAVDLRVVSATHADLEGRVGAGQFRADLWARLSAVTLELPPLAERVEDIPALASHALGEDARSLDADAIEALALHDWPLNVRELIHVLRAAVLDPREGMLARLPDAIRRRLLERREGTDAAPPAVPDELRRRLETSLRECDGNVRRACALAGISRSHAYELLKRWDIDPASYRR